MTYAKTTYANGTTPAINATNLNNAEDMIESLDDTLNTKGTTHRHTELNAATYTPDANDYTIGVKYTTTGAVTITLASAMATTGRCYIIMDEGGNAATNNITIDTEGAETINGAASKTIGSNYGRKRLYSDGTNWFIH